jgi:hypothetical protein
LREFRHVAAHPDHWLAAFADLKERSMGHGNLSSGS